MARLNAFQLQRLRQQLRNIEAQKKRVQAEIQRAQGKINGLSARDIPTRIVKKIEKQVNNEGYMEKIILGRFKAQARRIGGTRWKALTPGYLLRKVREGYGAAIGIRTGAMRQAALAAVHGTYRYGQVPNWRIEDVAVEYAEYFDNIRPLMLPPSRRELEPANNRAKALLKIELRKLSKGQK